LRLGALRDVRFGLRLLRKDVSFASAALLALTLGIGANTAIFSVVYAALLSPLPYPKADELVMVWSSIDGHNATTAAGDYLEWKRQNAVFQDLVAWSGRTFSLSVSGRPEAVQARVTAPGFFTMQGIPFASGRDFLPTEGVPGADRSVILTNRLWRERFGADPSILGRAVRLDGEPYSVVGVLAPGLPDRFESPLFVPLAFTAPQLNHGSRWLYVMGRLKPGIAVGSAAADMEGVAKRLAVTYPDSNAGWSVKVEPLKNAFTSPGTIRGLWLLMGAVGFVLLIACVNVANLLLARGAARQREMAVRSSLGATRAQLFTQLLTESLTLALLGGLLGAFCSWGILKAVVAILPPYSIPTEADIRLSLPVLAFTFAATTVAGVLCGSAPAWQVSGWTLGDTLREAGRQGSAPGRHGLRRSLVVVEFALAITLLTGAGLILRSFYRLTRVDLGFNRDHLLTFSLPVRPDRFPGSEATTAFYGEILDRLGALPGVLSVSASAGMPGVGAGFGVPFSIAGREVPDRASRPIAALTLATPGFFRTFGIQVTRGRAFTAQDDARGLRVALVDETFARKYFRGGEPLGARIVTNEVIPGARAPGPEVTLEIVGVYRDVHNAGDRDEEEPSAVVPFAQSPWPSATIAVRTLAEPSALAQSAAGVVQTIDPDLALNEVRTMDEIFDESLAGDRFATILLSTFAVSALLLAAVGIYGVMSFVVAQRTREIGLRMALGARPGQVLGLVFREGLGLALGGLAAGAFGTYFVGRAMESILYATGALDPLALGVVSALLLLAALLACYVPARRATRVDPMAAVRSD
jgi:putative ABC transport system permease protein